MVDSSCSTSDTRRVNLVTNQVIICERGKDREVFMTSRTYPWSSVTQIFHSGHCVVCSSSISGLWLLPFGILKLFLYLFVWYTYSGVNNPKKIKAKTKHKLTFLLTFVLTDIEEEQTTQWPKEKVQKNKQRSVKHTHKTKDRVTWTPLKTGGELWCSWKDFRNTYVWLFN
jgi:hypothetical protein